MSSRVGEAGFETRAADWLHADEAQERVLAGAAPLEAETVALADALGRALAEEVRASATLPPWDNSAMDGYAIRAADVRGASPSTPVVLSVVGVVRAGADLGLRVEAGEAVRIMTGAPLPRGADTVVRVEETDAEAESGRVRVLQPQPLRKNVRDGGQDMRSGDLLLTRGQAVTGGVVGVLAAAGCAHVAVHRAPTVALLATGDELRGLDRYEEVRRGEGVPESNAPMLSAMIRSMGAIPSSLGIAPDDVGALRARIDAAAGADVLVTLGGASMGEADLVKTVLDEAGYEQDFWRVKMRPGSPVSFGWLPRESRRQPVFGLPGNPSSAFVTFEIFVRPFLLRTAGHERVLRRTVTCVAGERIDTPAPLTYYQRVCLEHRAGLTVATLTGPQVSGLVRGLAGADGLAVIGPDCAGVDEGEPVDVLLLDTGPATQVPSAR